MTEVFPVIAGFLLGSLLAPMRPGAQRTAGAIACVLLGTTATIVSGEYRIGWEFLLVDIPLVALSAATALAPLRAMARRREELRAQQQRRLAASQADER